jgi:hypothetical protein
MPMQPEPLLWLDDHRGVYIPRDFASSFADRARSVAGVSEEQWAILEDPDHELYWDVWTEVCDNAKVTDENGIVYSVWQDGACWLIPEGMEWNERDEFFSWPQDDDESDDDNEESVI